MTGSGIALLALAGVLLVALGSRGVGLNPIGAAAAFGVALGIGLGLGTNVSGIVLAVYCGAVAVIVSGLVLMSRRTRR